MSDRYFLLKNNLAQEPKHEQKLGSAVWLYLYLLSWANSNHGELTFYLSTYCKKLLKEKEMVKSQLKLLEAEGYIHLKFDGENQFNIKINKPINAVKFCEKRKDVLINNN